MYQSKNQAISILLFVSFTLLTPTPVKASKCYGEQDCTACRTCNYCQNCNSGGTLCGVYYEATGTPPPWRKAPSKHQVKKVQALPSVAVPSSVSSSQSSATISSHSTSISKSSYGSTQLRNSQASGLSCQLGRKKLDAIHCHIFVSEPMPAGVPNSPEGHRIVSVSYRRESPHMTVWVNLIDRSNHKLYQSYVPAKSETNEPDAAYFAIPEKSLAHPFELMFFSGGEYAADARIDIPSLVDMYSGKVEKLH